MHILQQVYNSQIPMMRSSGERVGHRLARACYIPLIVQDENITMLSTQ